MTTLRIHDIIIVVPKYSAHHNSEHNILEDGEEDPDVHAILIRICWVYSSLCKEIVEHNGREVNEEDLEPDSRQ